MLPQEQTWSCLQQTCRHPVQSVVLNSRAAFQPVATWLSVVTPSHQTVWLGRPLLGIFECEKSRQKLPELVFNA